MELNEKVTNDFYDHIRGIMREKNMNQSRRAEGRDVTPAYVSILFSRRPEPSRELIARMSRALDVSQDELMSYFVIDDWLLREENNPHVAVMALREKSRGRLPHTPAWISVPIKAKISGDKLRLHAAREVLDRKETRQMDASRIELMEKLSKLSDDQLRTINDLAGVWLKK